MNTIDRINQLETDIPKYAKAYYEGNTLITDEEFDAMVDELTKLNPQSKVLTTGWGYVPGSKIKVPHKYGEVGSLAKAYDVADLKGVFTEIRSILMSPKLDGISCVVEYSDGKYVHAYTRGNGLVGIDKTDRLIDKVPHYLELPDGTPFTGEVRGELVISFDNFNELLKTNPDAEIRNLAAGIIARKDLDDDNKFIDFVPYKIQGSTNHSCRIFKSAESIKDFIRSNFRTPADYIELIRPMTNSYLEGIFNIFKTYGYPIDGIVLTMNDLNGFDEHNKVLYDEIAFKFEGDEAQSTVTDVDWTLSRTGKLIPRVWINPVHLSGAVISKATGFNAQYIKDNQISKGAVITILRSGEVIPDIQSIDKIADDYDESKVIPTTCPVCGHKLEWSGVNLVCTNNECDGQSRHGVLHWIGWFGRPDGLGSTAINQFLDEFKINTVDDLYKFIDTEYYPNMLEIRSRIAAIEGFGSVTVDNIKDLIINLTSPVDPAYFLCACNIPGLSWKRAQQIVATNQFKQVAKSRSSEDWARLVVSLSSLKGIGQSLVTSISNNLSKLIKYAGFINYEFLTPHKDDHSESSELRYVMMTGAISMKRSDFEKILNDNGFALTSKAKDAVCLICNKPSTSSKYKAAQSAGLDILTEDEFKSKYNIK